MARSSAESLPSSCVGGILSPRANRSGQRRRAGVVALTAVQTTEARVGDGASSRRCWGRPHSVLRPRLQLLPLPGGPVRSGRHAVPGARTSPRRSGRLAGRFGLDQPRPTSSSYYLQGDWRSSTSGISYQSRQPVWNEIMSRHPEHGGPGGHLGGAFGGDRHRRRDHRRLAAEHRRRPQLTTSTDGVLLDARLLAGHVLLMSVRRVLGWFPVGGIVDPGTDADRDWQLLLRPAASPGPARRHPHPRLPRRVRHSSPAARCST